MTAGSRDWDTSTPLRRALSSADASDAAPGIDDGRGQDKRVMVRPDSLSATTKTVGRMPYCRGGETPWRIAVVLAVAVLVIGCGGTAATPVPSAVPTATSTATLSATPAPTPIPTPTLTPSQAAAAHITESVTQLMNIGDDAGIEAWINAESDWIDGYSSLPVVRPYLAAMTQALIDLAFKDENTNLAITALALIKAAREVPGVELP